MDELIDNMTLKDVNKRYSIDDVLNSKFMMKSKSEILKSPLKVSLKLKKENRKEFGDLLLKLQKQIAEKRMKIDQISRFSTNDKNKRTNKFLKEKIHPKSGGFVSKFETPQMNKINRRIGYSASVTKQDSSIINSNIYQLNTEKNRICLKKKSIFKYRNMKNMSNSLKRAIE